MRVGPKSEYFEHFLPLFYSLNVLRIVNYNISVYLNIFAIKVLRANEIQLQKYLKNLFITLGPLSLIFNNNKNLKSKYVVMNQWNTYYN